MSEELHSVDGRRSTVDSHDENEDLRLLLTAYADGALDHAVRLRVEAAVAEDPVLAAELAAIREQQQVLALLLPTRPSPEALDGLRRGRVLAEAVAATWVPARVPRLRWPWLVAGLAASLVVGLPFLTISVGLTLPLVKVVEGLSGGDAASTPARASAADAPPVRVSALTAPPSDKTLVVLPQSPASGNGWAYRDQSERDGKDVTRGREEAAAVPQERLLDSESVRSAMVPGLEGVDYESWNAYKMEAGQLSADGRVEVAKLAPMERRAEVAKPLSEASKPESQRPIGGRELADEKKKDQEGQELAGEPVPPAQAAPSFARSDGHDKDPSIGELKRETKLAHMSQLNRKISEIELRAAEIQDGFEAAQRGVDGDQPIASFPGPDLDIHQVEEMAKEASQQAAVIPRDGMVADEEIGGYVRLHHQERVAMLADSMQRASDLDVQDNSLNVARGTEQAKNGYSYLRRATRARPTANDLPFPVAAQRPVVIRGSTPLIGYLRNFAPAQTLVDRDIAPDLTIAGSSQPRPAALALVNAARCQNLQVQVQGESLAVTRRVVPQDPTQTFGLTPEDFKKAFGTTPMQTIAVNQQQTFSLDADTASYAGCVAQVAAQQAVDPATVRVEHFVNAVPMDLPEPTGADAFALYAEAGPSPFAAGRLAERTALVTVGVVGRAADAAERRPLNLVLAVDISGSMAQPGGLQRLRMGLAELLPHLRAEDKIAVITFAERAVVALPPVGGDATAQVQSTLAALRPDGATNAAEGLALAYQVAGELAAPGRETRVVLATDGATVTGPAATAALARVAGYRSKGITLLLLALGDRGAGTGLGTLADKASGQQVAVTSDAQAQTLFRTTLLPERLQVLARDAKAQVTWNPARVSHARLIGYEERRLEAQDFRNDAVDAGELSQAARATALFEVVLVEGAGGPLGQAAVRYLDTRLNQVVELSCPLPGDLVKSQASSRLRLAACAAEAGELLQQGWWSNVRGGTWPRLHGELQRLPASPVQQQLLDIANNMRARGPQGEP